MTPFPSKSEKAYYLFMCAILIVVALLLYTYENKEIIHEKSFDPLDWFSEAHYNTSCQGIFAYYSGWGFTHDAIHLKNASLEAYSIDSEWRLLPPMAIQTGEQGFDCEDITHAALCLASMYPNVRCNYYYQVWNGQLASHIGVNCTEKITLNNQTRTLYTNF